MTSSRQSGWQCGAYYSLQPDAEARDVLTESRTNMAAVAPRQKRQSIGVI